MPHGVLWSEDAIASYGSWPLASQGPASRGARVKPPKTVTLDHLVPQKQLLDGLLPQIEDHDAHSLVDFMREHHRTALLCDITDAEDKAIRGAGLLKVNHSPDRPFERYKQAGIKVSKMRTLDPSPACLCA